jgi:hypothetical protein
MKSKSPKSHLALFGCLLPRFSRLRLRDKILRKDCGGLETLDPIAISDATQIRPAAGA